MLEAWMIHSMLNPFHTKHEINLFERLAPSGLDLFDVWDDPSNEVSSSLLSVKAIYSWPHNNRNCKLS
jgi:hypothetical protein